MQPLTFTIIAGPNGSGKSTFIQKYFLEYVQNGRFINADDIAHLINPFDNESAKIAAARLAIQKRQLFLKEKKESFLIETTLASQTILRSIDIAKESGFSVILHFLWIAIPTICDFRVKDRVSKGGHDINLSVILRRYSVGLKLLNTYINKVDEAHIYRADESPSLIALKNSNELKIIQERDWNQLQNDIKLFEK